MVVVEFSNYTLHSRLQEEIPYSCEVVMEGFEDKSEDFSVLKAAVRCECTIVIVMFVICFT